MRPSPPVRLDAEVIELLRDSPELLAIADAISATQAPPGTRRRTTRLAALAAVIGLAVALALVSPWSGRGSLVDRALAAIGSGEVIHVVQSSELQGRTLLDLRTGEERPVVRTREIWFDGERGLLRSVQRIDGTVTSEVLETPQGSWTEAGRVYTCAWIAAHPVEATKARVSCNPSGKNATRPRRVPEPRPALDPALAGFVSGYRDALASGQATRDGSGTVDGRAVEWLRFALGAAGDEGEGRVVERVAVDADTFVPVRVETLGQGELVDEATISVAETLDRAGVTFARPKLVAPGSEPVSTRVVAENVVPLEEADTALGGRLVDTGATLAGLPRSTLTLQTVVSGYGADSGREPTRSAGVAVLYGGRQDAGSPSQFVLVRESTEPLMLYLFGALGSGGTPPEGTIAISRGALLPGTGGLPARPLGETFTGHMRVRGVYVTIDASSRALVLEAARALEASEP